MAGAGNDRYIDFRDMIDGGGAGRSGREFEGAFGPLLDTLGIRPLGYREAHAADMEREQRLAEARARAYRTQPARPAPPPAPTSTYGAPLLAPQMPPQTRMGVGPTDFQYPSALPAIAPPTVLSGPPPAGPGVRPQEYAPPAPDVRAAFADYISSDPHRLGVYESASDAAQHQMFLDFKRGARF